MNTEKLSAPARTCEEQVVALTEKERPREKEAGRQRGGTGEGGGGKSPPCCRRRCCCCRRLKKPSSPLPPPPPPPSDGTPPLDLPSFFTSTIFSGLTIQRGTKGRNGPAALAAMTRPPEEPPPPLSSFSAFCFRRCQGKAPGLSSRGLFVETQGRASACCHEDTALTARS